MKQIFLSYTIANRGTYHYFNSKKAKLDGTKAIRGGIPVCFPQFGPWEFGAQHGFARVSKDWKIFSGPVVDEITGDAKVGVHHSTKKP